MSVDLNMFENLNMDIDSFRKATVDKFDEFREKVVEFNGQTFKLFVAMVNAPGIYNDPLAREARGIVYTERVDQPGSFELVSRPLHKFFNYGENQFSDATALRDRKILEIMDKRDGTMIHQVKLAGEYEYVLKTKKSITGDGFNEIHTIRKWVKDHQNYDLMFQFASEAGITVICEWTAPTNRIVIEYAEPQLTVLHMRDNETGEYYSRAGINTTLQWWFGDDHDIAVVENSSLFDENVTFPQIVEWAKTAKGVEGVVVLLDNMDMVKVKTAWYLSLHHTLTDLTPRGVFDAIIAETIDDLKSTLYLNDRHDDLEKLQEVELHISGMLEDVEAKIKSAFEIGLTFRSSSMNNKEIFDTLRNIISAPHYDPAYLQIALKAARTDKPLEMEEEFTNILAKTGFRKSLGFNSICGFSASDE